jgi:hypothetical protein
VRLCSTIYALVFAFQAIAEDLCERAQRVVADDTGAKVDVLFDATRALLTRAFWLFETLASYVGMRVVVRFFDVDKYLSILVPNYIHARGAKNRWKHSCILFSSAFEVHCRVA